MNLEDRITHEIEMVRQAYGHIEARLFARHLIQKVDEFNAGAAEVDQPALPLPAPEPTEETGMKRLAMAEDDLKT